MVNLPIKYLGMSLGAKFKDVRHGTWDIVVTIFERRLVGRKRSLLLKGGRLTLIKNTLSNLPIYWMSRISMSVSVAKKLEALQCRFLWGDSDEKRSYHFVAWGEVKKPICEGELGMRSMLEMNRVLEGKWIWQFMNERDAFWRRIIEKKYGIVDRGWYSRVNVKP